MFFIFFPRHISNSDWLPFAARQGRDRIVKTQLNFGFQMIFSAPLTCVERLVLLNIDGLYLHSWRHCDKNNHQLPKRCEFKLLSMLGGNSGRGLSEDTVAGGLLL